MSETYAVARQRLFGELAALGWKVVTRNMGRDLKFPYVVSPSGSRFTFTPQAVRSGGLDGNSMWIDIRGMDAASFARACGS